MREVLIPFIPGTFLPESPRRLAVNLKAPMTEFGLGGAPITPMAYVPSRKQPPHRWPSKAYADSPGDHQFGFFIEDMLYCEESLTPPPVKRQKPIL